MEEIISWFSKIDPVLAALLATTFTWLVTAMGAAMVFGIKSMHRGMLDGMLGFTGGIMVAASFWSLLAPSIEMSPGEGFVKVFPAAIIGAFFVQFHSTIFIPFCLPAFNEVIQLF